MIKTQLRNTFIILVISIALVFGIGAATKKEALSYTPGTYYGTATGNAEGLWVKVDFSEDSILSVEVIEHHETSGICEPAIEQIPVKIITTNSPYVDAVSGATKTSDGIKNAVISCMNQAAGKEEIVQPPVHEDPVPLEYSYNPGTYSASAKGFYEDVKVEVTFSETAITEVKVTDFARSEYGDERVAEVQETVIPDILKWQTYGVDACSGATYTSQAVMEAVQKCVEQAKK
ncbi:MAG: FMN-binding protein [Firmicutes bacterium]|nr:FMN-binding protein [Bacillota bacterium]